MMNTLYENQTVYTPEGNDSPGYPTSWGVPLPRYQNCSGDEIPSGLYLALWHGRRTPDEKSEGRCFDAPMIGPLSWVHMTDMHILRLDFSDPEVAERYFPGKDEREWALDIAEGMIQFDGRYFGSWTVFVYLD
ncbi:hypothetical protein CAGGBEG34_30040 [Candidatus Glomeribacter gigasporarum BEG34]|uniref:Uncharacterized protein n=1 Tax=Candidatus Glomeribacter gigasporarum BEG34 TaxID=1070319 RepID=G2JBC2_9BURK|nr:hypothetical protein [Candidatus Glomeribacter gigasporarum]CCD30076.1 hypothetical protein CAGGBEG34_30040 [Candidatus Glomeribacter gigasporarum BEG34]